MPPDVDYRPVTGHATMEMTMRYAHLSPEVKREAVQVLDRPVPGNFGAHVGHMEG
jgi:hypothetical protein